MALSPSYFDCATNPIQENIFCFRKSPSIRLISQLTEHCSYIRPFVERCR
ncbi:MAG: hypothetical protein OJF50_001741 [Nitrospira sp.]|nr:hypothetical protein [Nitrospira sp.]